MKAFGIFLMVCSGLGWVFVPPVIAPSIMFVFGFVCGLLVACFGAVADEIDEAKQQARKDADGLRDAIVKGFEMLAQRQAMTVPSSTPAATTSAPAAVPRSHRYDVAPINPLNREMGRCPKCRQPRLQFTPKCEQCGSTRDVVFD